MCTIDQHMRSASTLQLQLPDAVVKQAAVPSASHSLCVQVLRYMQKHGLPDDTCLPYSATDFTKFAGNVDEAGNALKECPDASHCSNCMPIETPAPGQTVEVCWAVPSPITYKVRVPSAEVRHVRIHGSCNQLPAISDPFAPGEIPCKLFRDLQPPDGLNMPFLYLCWPSRSQIDCWSLAPHDDTAPLCENRPENMRHANQEACAAGVVRQD